jgi:hypothetical protein
MTVVLLETEKWDYFKEAVTMILSSWTALQLATESDESKWQELVELIFDYFQQDAVEIDHLEYNFYEWFLDECSVEVEDRSMLLVARDLVDLHKELMTGNLGSFNLLKKAYSSKSASKSLEQSQDEEMLPATSDATANTKTKIIDEDGFELVQKRKK